MIFSYSEPGAGTVLCGCRILYVFKLCKSSLSRLRTERVTGADDDVSISSFEPSGRSLSI